MAAGPSPPDLATWGHLLGFSLEDLALNRRGIVSPDQLRGWVSYIISDAVLPLICLGCAVLVAYMPRPWWRWLIVAGMVGLSTLSSMNFVRRIQDHQHPQTLAVEGHPEGMPAPTSTESHSATRTSSSRPATSASSRPGQRRRFAGPRGGAHVRRRNSL